MMSRSMNRSIGGNPRIHGVNWETPLSASSAGDSTDGRAREVEAQTATVDEGRPQCHQVRPACLVRAMPALRPSSIEMGCICA